MPGSSLSPASSIVVRGDLLDRRAISTDDHHSMGLEKLLGYNRTVFVDDEFELSFGYFEVVAAIQNSNFVI